jgi:hypothetical protein
MYENTEVIIRFSSVEVQQVIAIWLDNDAEEALRLIKEKIVDKTVQAACKPSAGRKMAPCHVVRYNCACCRAGGVGRVSAGASLRRR